MKDTVVGRIEQLTGTAVTAAIGQAGRPGVELVDLAEISRLKARIAQLEAALREIADDVHCDDDWPRQTARAALGFIEEIERPSVPDYAKSVTTAHCPKCGERLGPDGHHVDLDPATPF